ncbi:hypothetical protein [Bacillus wiedmannii]|uniref:hypothetical protein n=1 Tax=Bacillus wiedmannii TaxID=1890302 RepID=UPI0021D0EE59|nr:hypothetical protein [Bacillus wiedmannii]MCU5096114.1 hypothetical protein [Bacillus wiedmannii]
MVLKYGKQINYLSVFFILIAFIGFLSFATWLSEYSSSNIFTMFKGSMWVSIALAIIGFRQEKSSVAMIVLGICAVTFIGLYAFSVIDYLQNPRP